MNWPRDIRADFLRLVEAMLEFGPDLGMPRTRALGSGLFEMRARGREGIGRTFYCVRLGEQIVILHAIIKKTEKTPARALDTARARLKEINR